MSQAPVNEIGSPCRVGGTCTVPPAPNAAPTGGTVPLISRRFRVSRSAALRPAPAPAPIAGRAPALTLRGSGAGSEPLRRNAQWLRQRPGQRAQQAGGGVDLGVEELLRQSLQDRFRKLALAVGEIFAGNGRRSGSKGSPLCPPQTDIGYQFARLSEINSSISAPLRSTIDNAIMTSLRATSTGYRHDSPAFISVQKPQCVREFARAPWWVAWIGSPIVTATNATEVTKIRSIVFAQFPVRCSRRCAQLRRTNKEAPGEMISEGFLDRRDWVHPPIQRH